MKKQPQQQLQQLLIRINLLSDEDIKGDVRWDIIDTLNEVRETPLAYLTKENCLWMQDPEDENRYIPNPNARGSYHESYCIERGDIPIYDPNLIEHFQKPKR